MKIQCTCGSQNGEVVVGNNDGEDKTGASWKWKCDDCGAIMGIDLDITFTPNGNGKTGGGNKETTNQSKE